ncbi:MAG: CDP-alcohol phosphatidyltransferase family protein [Chloroflexota bacterium]|nr:CDP-alcohol phosphatidyltransferase family protein [Chloroflexota bacterium]
MRHVADALTAFRAICGLILPVWPSLPLLVVAIVTDWLDGPLARRRPPAGHGPRFDLEADSLLTLGAAIAAVRVGAPRVAMLAPFARYAVAIIRTGPLTPDEVRWDRLTGVAQMAVLAAALAPMPLRPLRILALPVSAARCAAMLVQAERSR